MSHHSSRLRAAAVAVIASTAFVPTDLAAQQTGRQVGNEIQLGEVVVDSARRENARGPVNGYVARESATGTKTATPLIETPQAITVVGATQIRDLGAQSVVEATQYVSGLRAATFGFDTRNDWYLIRGFPGQVSGYFLDGLQLYSNSFATFRLDPFGLERLEVLKGPASVLYGGSNVGGIINAVSKLPPDQAHGYLETGINNYGNAYGAFDIGGPVSKAADNTFFYRLEGEARAGGTQTDFIKDDRLFLAPSLAWRPDLDTSVTLLANFQKDRTNGQNFLPYVGTVTPAPFGRISSSLFTSDPGYDHFNRDQNMVGYQIEHRINQTFTVRQNMRFADLKIDYQTLYGSGFVSPAADLGRFNFTTRPHVQEVALDNQLEARFRTGPLGHVALIGLDYKHYTLSNLQDFGFGPSINVLNPVYYVNPGTTPFRLANSLQTQDQVGEYVQEQAKLGPLTLVLSGRHDGLATSLYNRQPGTTNIASGDDALTGRAGLIYTAPAGIAPYVTYATSFDPQLGTNTSTGALLKPTTGQLTEVGVKYQPLGMNLNVTGSLFNLVQQNVLTTDPANIMNQIQSGEQRSRGFEIEAVGYVAPGLKVLASYTGYQLRVTSDLNQAIVGKVPTAVPQNFGAALVDYTVQSGPLTGFGGGIGPRYTGGSFANNTNTLGVPGYVVGDLNVHFDRGPWRAALNVRNFTDREKIAACSTTGACFYDQRRTALVSLGYKW